MSNIRAFGLICMAIFLSVETSVAQLQRVDTIKVFQNSIQLKNPWAGGLNFAQFSEIDLNNDNIKDLFVFDRTGNKVRTFINEGTANTVAYKHAPEYEGVFPTMHDWALLRDYNCDGKEDIFTFSSGGFAVYRNTSTPGNITFTKVSDQIKSYYGSMPFLNLWMSPIDIPAFVDVDYDGDLDVLTFDIGEVQVEFHQNQSMETLGNCDTLLFHMVESCWGTFQESPSNNSVFLNASCKGGGGQGDSTLQTMHSGSTSCVFDIECDNDMDLLLGDISSNNLNMLYNGGDNTSANITSQDVTFPSSNVPINQTTYPAAFYLDVNNNGQKDLLVSPNANGASENFKSVKFYEDTNTTCSTTFDFRQSDFLQNGMIELGEGAYPQFFDYNSDGAIDLMLGNYGYWKPSNLYSSGLSLYKNTGTNINPVFELISTDFCSLSNFNLTNVFPTFGDLDNDGDQDLIIGDAVGNIRYFKNTPIANEANFMLVGSILKDNNNTTIDVGNDAAPFLYDIDNDNLLDLIIGSMSGNLIFYRNIGSPTAFDFKKITTALGGVDVRSNPNLITGYSAPFFVKDNGQTKLLVGSERGYIYYYNNIDGNLTGTFTKVDSMLGNIYDGIRNSVSCYKCGSTYLCANGNYAGGVSLYSGDIISALPKEPVSSVGQLLLFPNPTTSTINISIANSEKNLHTIWVFDSFGNSVMKKTTNSNKFEINVEHLASGFYIVKVLDSNGKEYLSKFVVCK